MVMIMIIRRMAHHERRPWILAEVVAASEGGMANHTMLYGPSTLTNQQFLSLDSFFSIPTLLSNYRTI